MPILCLCIVAISLFFYAAYRRQLREVVTLNSLNTVSQATRYLDSWLDAMFSDLVTLEKYTKINDVFLQRNLIGKDKMDSQVMIDLHAAINNMHNDYADLIDSIFWGFELPDGRKKAVCFASNRAFDVDFSFQASIGSHRLDEVELNRYIWVEAHHDTISREIHRDREDLITVFKVIKNANSDTRYLLYANLKASFFRDVLAGNTLGDSMYLALVGNGKLTTFNDIPTEREILVDALPAAGAKQAVLTMKNRADSEVFFVYDTLRLSGWRLAAVISANEILSHSTYLVNTAVAAAAGLLLFGLAVLFIGARIIMRPIERWVKKVKAVESDELNITFDEAGCYEMDQLNLGLQYLIGRIRQLLADMQHDYDEKRKLEMQILQQQINPHFIYNTLYSIQQLCKAGENDGAVQMIRNMANLFRISLSKGNEQIALEDEIQHVTAYMEIQTMRYDQIRFEVKIEPTLLQQKIIKMVLQPLVENSIYHGIYDSLEGNILIEGFRQNKDIVLRITNGGMPIDAELLFTLNHCMETDDWSGAPHSFGVRNVHQRLRLAYGRPYGLQMERSADCTITLLRIPLEAGENSVC